MMAFKLTKQESNRRDELVNDLRDKFSLLENAINEDPKVLNDISTAAATFQVIVSEAEEFRDEIASRLREEYDEKSEKWQEGDKGSAVSEFIDEWENADFSSLDLDLANPEDIEIDGIEDYAEILENLPEETS